MMSTFWLSLADHTGSGHSDNLDILKAVSKYTLKSQSRHDANFVITDGTGGCHNNLRCHQWRQSWHYYNFRLVVIDWWLCDVFQFVTVYRYIFIKEIKMFIIR